MKIYINKNLFLEALQLIVNISPKVTTDPIINNVLLETRDWEGKQVIEIKATNHEHTFLGRFEVEIIEFGKICVNTSKLFNLVRDFSGNKINIQSTPQNWVFLFCDNSKVKLPGVDPENFPVIEFKSLEGEFKLPGKIFRTAIERTFFAIGENESRKNLMGLNLKIVTNNVIYWTGADAFRISQYKTELETSIQAEGNIVIPKNSLAEIKRILDFSDEEINISFNDSTFQVSSQHVYFKTRLIEAEYPNLDRLLNTAGHHSLVLQKQELINAVKILSTVTDGDINSVMKLTVQDGKMLVESQKLEFGEGNDEINCNYTGQAISIGLNIRFFLDCLQVFEASEEEMITINITDHEAPISLQCNEWQNLKIILMPVRIKW